MTNPSDGFPNDPNEKPWGAGDPATGPAGGAPNYGQPDYSQPQYGQPDYSQQQYGQPAYGQPFGASGGVPAGPPPANSLASSIVVTVLGFLFTCGSCISLAAGIIGIVAIVKANSVNGLWNSGNAAGAQSAADEAKKWSNIAWIVFGVSIVLWIVAMIVMVVSGSTVGYYDFSTN